MGVGGVPGSISGFFFGVFSVLGVVFRWLPFVLFAHSAGSLGTLLGDFLFLVTLVVRRAFFCLLYFALYCSMLQVLCVLCCCTLRSSASFWFPPLGCPVIGIYVVTSVSALRFILCPLHFLFHLFRLFHLVSWAVRLLVIRASLPGCNGLQSCSVLCSMATPSRPRSIFHRNREFLSGPVFFRRLDWALAYSIRDYWQGLLIDEDLPPPLDRNPLFPPVCFTSGGEPVLVGPSLGVGNMVVHIVPHPDSPYSRRFGVGGYRGWNTPEETLELVEAWAGSGRDVVVHPRRPGVQVTGESRGFARFVIGAGISLFVVREVGFLPDGARLGGEVLTGMIATLGVAVPGSGDRFLEYHLVPAEYLIDPYLPGMPPDLSREDLIYHLPPPPIFCRGRPVAGVPGLYHSLVGFGVSEREADEGSRTFSGQTLRGGSYRMLRGMSPDF